MNIQRWTLMLALASLPCVAAAQPPQLIPELIGSFKPSRINEAGQIIGVETLAGNQRGFVVTPGQPPTYLPLPAGAASSWALDVNDLGVVVGRVGPYYSPEFAGVAIAWDPDGQGGYSYRLLGALPGQSQGAATAVNNLGDIVGYSSDGTYRYAVFFTAPGGVVDLNGLGIFDPSDINDQRVLVDNSFTVKRMDLDTMIVEDLGHPPGSYIATRSVRINEAGQVAGQAIRSNGGNADREVARYTDGIGWQTFSTNGVNNGATDLNEPGDMTMIVGLDTFVWYEELGSAYLLDALILNTVGQWHTSRLSGFTMNSAGWIAVFATNDATGQAGTLLLRPNDPSEVGSEGEAGAGLALALSNRPNPFRGRTEVTYSLPNASPVALDVLDSSGRVVRRLVEARQGAGAHRIEWDGRSDAGRPAPAGLYLMRLSAGGRTATMRMTRLR